jgi:hypothetical protein
MAAGYPTKANYATGDILTATNMNDLAGTVNLAVSATPTTATQMAGKNKIINGDFGIWQRGTSFSALADQAYFADRFSAEWYANGATNVFSRQTFTPGSAPVAGYESSYFARCAVTSGAAGTIIGTSQKIENVQTFAGQTVTVSFWAKADTARAMSLYVVQNFGSGGSTSVTSITSISNNTTSWVRYSITTAIPSISGKTIGTSSYLSIGVIYNGSSSALNNATLDLWGVQVEAGSSATAFQTATGTLQGELAACQRYYWRGTSTFTYAQQAFGMATSTTAAILLVQPPTVMRTVPSSIEYATLVLSDGVSSPNISALTINSYNNGVVSLNATSTGMTAYRPYFIINFGSTAAYLGLNAEL